MSRNTSRAKCEVYKYLELDELNVNSRNVQKYNQNEMRSREMPRNRRAKCEVQNSLGTQEERNATSKMSRNVREKGSLKGELNTMSRNVQKYKSEM